MAEFLNVESSKSEGEGDEEVAKLIVLEKQKDGGNSKEENESEQSVQDLIDDAPMDGDRESDSDDEDEEGGKKNGPHCPYAPKCPMTGTVTERRIHLLNIHEEAWFVCGDCDSRLIKEEDWRVHYRQKHFSVRHCCFCPPSEFKTFSSHSKCAQHEKHQHGLEMGLFRPSGFTPDSNFFVTHDEVLTKFSIDVSNTTALPTDEYVSFYDVSRKTPVMVMELMTARSIANVFDDRPPFQPDEPLGDLQLNEAIINAENLAVGHMAAAMGHRSSKAAYESTFLWRNLIALQPSVNTGPMQCLEAHQLALVPFCDTLLVVTAPHYAETNVPIPVAGIGNMIKPDGIVKIMVMLRKNRIATVDAFYVPNRVIPTQSIFRFREKIEKIEKMLGRKVLGGYRKEWIYVSEEEATRFRCSVQGCRKLFEEESELHEHYAEDHAEIRCHHCRRIFGTEEEKKNHIAIVHLKYGCDECEKRFTSTSALTRHKAVHSESRPFVCVVCGSAFKRRDNLTEHERIHNNNEFSCPTCARSFSLQIHLTSHLLEVHQMTDDMPRPVSKPKVTVSVSGLKKTIMQGRRTATPQVAGYTCEHCGKLFKNKGHYDDHLTTHSDARPFICPCGASFKVKKSLTRHERKNCLYS